MRGRRRYRAQRRPRIPPSASIAPVAQHRGGNAQLACDLAQRPTAAHQQGYRFLLELIRKMTPSLAHSTPFRSRRSLAKVSTNSGEPHSPWKSGSIDQEQGISKAGNPRLRTTMVELAWMWVRYQPASALSCWFRQRVGSERGRIRRISIVALARKLLIALARYLSHGEIPAGAVMKAG